MFLMLMGPRLYNLTKYKKTKGFVFGFESKDVQVGINSHTIKYPKVTFFADKDRVTVFAPSAMAEVAPDMDSVTVYYDSKDPTKAIVYNYYGVWSPATTILIPFFLIWTICIFSKDFIPTHINTKDLSTKLFG